MKTLLFISKKYWMGNKKLLLQLCTVIILATAALFCACLYGRSSLLAQLDEILDSRGNFDISVYYPDEEIEAYLEADTRFTESAKIYWIGSIGPSDNPSVTADAGYFENELAIDMFHLPLLEGRYPERKGELCIDQKTLQSWGYSARAGQTLILSVYDGEGVYQGDRDYLLTGIIGVTGSNTNHTYTLRTDYLNGWDGFEAYTPPLCYISFEEGEALAQEGGADYIFLGNIAYTGDYDDNAIWGELISEFRDRIILSTVGGISRSETAAIITMQENAIQSRIGGYSPGFSHNETAITSGQYLTKNFYNGFLIPCFTALLVLLTVCSVYSVLHLALRKRSPQFGILRCVGMSMGQVIAMLLLETGILLGACIGIGYLFGAGIYAFSLKMQEILFGQKVFYAFSLDPFWGRYIRMVTFSPAKLPWMVVGLTVVAVMAFYFGNHISENPLSMIQKERSDRKKRRSIRSLGTSLMGGRHAGLALLLTIMIGAVGFGYFSCRVQAEKEAASYQNLLWQIGVSNYEYTASLTISSTMFGSDQMLHESGLDAGQVQVLVSDEAVGEYVLYAVNASSKLVYEPGGEKEEFISGGSHAYREVTGINTNAYWEECNRLAWLYRGFPDPAGIYQAPMLGLAEENISLLTPYVVEGELHPEKIVSGEEVILLAKENRVCDYFSVGEVLPMADVVFEPEIDENEGILRGMVPEEMEPVTYVEGVPLYVMGERLDFPVRIGAIAVLDEEGQELFYGSLPVPDSGVRIVTTLGAMQNFGLPDHNYTNLYLNLNPDADRTAFENEWYSLIAHSGHMTGYCLPDIRADFESTARASMILFYCLFILLAVIGAISVYNLITVILYNARKKIAIVRAVGGTGGIISRMILKKVVWYPLIAGIFGAIFIYGYTGISRYAQNLINESHFIAFNGQYPDDWYWHFPIQDFWNYALHRFLIGIVVLILALLLFFTVKQLRTLLHQGIPEELERE